MSENIKQDRLKEITESIERGIRELFASDKYQQYLQTMSRFHRYSVNNTVLIHMQKPNATLVAGFGKWRDQFQRHVLKGERAIKIIAPTPYTVKSEQPVVDPDTKAPVLDKDGNIQTEEVEIRIPRYRVVSVFDVSQTDGKPLPSLADDLTGSVHQYDVFMEALRRTSPVPIEIHPILRNTDGFFDLTAQKITLREGMSEIQTISAAVHEIAHAKLHNIDSEKDRNTEEVEAESISYAVCQYYGIETSGNSFGYIANWSEGRELKELRASLETISKTSSELITDIDKHLAELTKETPSVDTPLEHEDVDGHIGAFGVKRDEIPAHEEYVELVVGHELTPSERMNSFLNNPADAFAIYQLKDMESTHDLRFEPLTRVQAAGQEVKLENYDLVYTAPLPADSEKGTFEHLNDLFFRFNHDRPEDFRGHSLSVSDIVALKQADRVACFYVDRWGFKELTDFHLRDNPLRNAEMTMEDDYGMIDGVINNGRHPAKEKKRDSVVRLLRSTECRASDSHSQKNPRNQLTER